MIVHILLSSVLLLFSFGQLGRITLVNDSVTIYLYEVVLIVIIAHLFFQYKLRPLLALYTMWPTIFFFLIFVLFSFIISAYKYAFVDNAISALYLVRLCFYTVFLAYITYFFQKQKTFGTIATIYLLSTSLLTVVLTAIQYILYPDLRNLFYQGWDPHLYRAFGTFLEPVVLGSILGLLAIYFFLQKSKTSLIFLLASLFTLSRGVYAGLLTVSSVYFNRSPKLLLYVIITIIVVVVLLPKPYGEGVNLLRTSTVQSRADDFNEALEVWKTSPILGIGYNRIRNFKKEKNIAEVSINHGSSSYHSSFSTILVTTGIVGLALFLKALVDFALLSPVAFFEVLFLSVVSLFDNMLLHPFLLFLLFLTTAFSLTRPSRTSP